MDTFPNLFQEEEDIEVLIENHITKDQAETLDKPAQTEKPSGDVARKTSGFRMNGMNFILTFPQCATTKEIAVERLEQKWKDEMKGYIVCEEQHKDGTPHLHVFLQFTKRKNFKDPHWADFIAGKHGDYKVCKSVSGSVRYVTKDGKYIAKGVDVESYQKKGRQGQQPYCGHARQGKDSGSGERRGEGVLPPQQRKIEEYAAFIECENSKKSKLEWKPPCTDGLTDANKQIAEWICSNIRRTRSFKAPSFLLLETESWEDLSRRVVEEISISVPYANNGRVLRPLLGRLRP